MTTPETEHKADAKSEVTGSVALDLSELMPPQMNLRSSLGPGLIEKLGISDHQLDLAEEILNKPWVARAMLELMSVLQDPACDLGERF